MDTELDQHTLPPALPPSSAPPPDLPPPGRSALRAGLPSDAGTAASSATRWSGSC
ncbi:hypothetical protein PJ267_00650 [Arthrobacter sp. OVS8]|nr:hypothetical protein PJ267_00650 [Arthrobacter sp. OVS8]